MASSFFRSGVLRRAWSTTWGNKSLWFFGLFAAILAIGEEYDVLVRNPDILDSLPRWLDNLRRVTEQGFVGSIWQSLSNSFANNPTGAATIALTWIVSVVALAWLVIVSQAALIEGARQHDEGRSLHILGGLDTGMANFWSIFKVNVIAKLIVYGSLLIVVAPLGLIYLRTGSLSSVLLATFWTFVILFPLITIASFVQKFASAFIVIKKYPVRQAIAAGWALFIKHWLVTLELTVILILINLGVIYATTSTVINLINFPQVSTFGYLFFVVTFGFVFAWLTTFQYAAWTNLFLRFEEGAAHSKLRRIVHYILDIREKPSAPAAARARR